jgi:lycopene beta-cyclase
MTYGGFLLVFLLPPILLLVWGQRKKLHTWELAAVASISVIALVYTPLWDNYLVANKIWWYDEARVWGIKIGWVPLEEYLFFVLQPLMTGLWVAYLRRFFPEAPIQEKSYLRYGSVAGVGLIWAASVATLILDIESLTYLSLILAWALPPVILQLAHGADILVQRGKWVGFALASSTLYLSLGDAIAMHNGIWTINSEKQIEVYLGGILPFEEFFFFFITNVLVVFSVVLLLSAESYSRLRLRHPQNRTEMI